MRSHPREFISSSKVVLCIGCNYDLQGQVEPRCPECGRNFDGDDVTTFNTGRPLNRFDRWLLAPLGPPTAGLILLLTAGVLYLSLSSAVYCTPVQFMLVCMYGVAVFVILAIRLVSREKIPPKSVPRPGDNRRVAAAGILAFVTTILVITQVPLRIAFLFARPALDRLMADIKAGDPAATAGAHRAGPMVVTLSPIHGNKSQHFFDYTMFGVSGGVAYSESLEPLEYNAGNDGYLGGNWYWWVDD